MKKRLLASLMVAALIASMTSTALATDESGFALQAETGSEINTETTLSNNLVVNEGETLTIGAPVTISGNVTISGSGTIQRAENYTGILFKVPADAALTVQGVTIDGGAVWSDSNTNTGVTANESLFSVSGSLTLDGNCTLQNNYRGKSASGGAIYADENGRVTVKHATIQKCAAKHGGAIYADQRTEGKTELGLGNNLIAIEDGAKLTNNIAAGAGGAIRTETGNFKMSGGSISNNSSNTRGGGVDINGCIADFEISGGTIQNNTTTNGFGGGISFYGVMQPISDVTGLNISNLTVKSNTAAMSGGGIFMEMKDKSRLVALDKVSVESNSVSGGNENFNGGGGIKFLGSLVDMKDCTVTNNGVAESDTYSNGGGIDLKGSDLTAENLSVTNNSATHGAGIYLGADSSVLKTALKIKGKIIISNLSLTRNVVTVVGAISEGSDIHINAPESSTTPVYIGAGDSYQIQATDYSRFKADGEDFSLKLDSAENRIAVQKETSWDVSQASDGSVKASVMENGNPQKLTLYITGNGAMKDYKASNKRPYYENIPIYGTTTKLSKDHITAVEIEDGVTHIGAYAFASCPIQNVVLPYSVASIGLDAFAWNNKKQIVIVYINNNSIAWNLTQNETNIAKVFLNDGTFADNTTFESGKFATPTRAGFTFDGWYEDADFNGNPVTTPENGKTYYAKWNAKLTQTAPAAPTLKDRTYTSITLDKIADSENGAKAEYSKDGGATWKTSPEFTDLTSGTTYTFAVRYAETDKYLASPISETAQFTTLRHSSSHSSGSSSTTNTVSASTASNGKVTMDKSSAKKGDTVTITVTPDAGYELGKLTVTDAKGNTIATTKKDDNKYTFTMPDGKVTVTPTFTKIAEEKPSASNYVDVASSAWYADAVKYVADKGLMSGTGDKKFSPNGSTTRGMLMTVLARCAGKDTAGSTPWYQAGMDWAKENGVSDGTKPTENITREQLVTMLYRSAGSPAASGSLDNFSDSASVSGYAVNAMKWAVANGIVNGSNGKLNPKNNATRAEVAAILMRFCEKTEK